MILKIFVENMYVLCIFRKMANKKIFDKRFDYFNIFQFYRQ